MLQQHLALLGLLSSAALAQTASSPATVPSNYHGPTVVGACFYTQNNAAFYAYPITISNYFRMDAERAFHNFVQTSTGQALPATCRWVTEQQYNASKDKSFTAKNNAGQPVPATRVNWQYTPGSGGVTAPAASAASPYPGTAASRAAANRTATGNTTANTPTTSTATPNTSTGNVASNTVNSATTGVGNSISDSVNSSKQAITSSGATAVTDTMSSATTAVTGAMQSGMNRLMHHGKKGSTDASSTAQPATAQTATAPAAAAAPAPAAFAVTADTATPGTPAAPSAGGGPGFVFCHLVSSGSEYVSDIFPSTDSSDAAAQTAFWRQVGHQYKIGSIPFSNNVTCARSGSETGATSARQTLMATAPTKGLKVVDTQWTWMGPGQ